MKTANTAVLCADAEALQHPGTLGLPDENLQAQPWLKTFSDAKEARSYIAGAEAPGNVWIAGSDQVDAINLAAAISSDGGSPSLVSFQASGSLYSRAKAAGIAEVLDKRAFLQHYGACKQAAYLSSAAAESVVPHEPTRQDGAAASGGIPASIAGARPQDSSVGVAPGQAPARFGGTVQAALQVQEPVRVAQTAGSAFAMPKTPSTAVATSGKGQVIAVVGAGGGMGKSTLAVVCACLAQHMGYRTVLLDADLQAGDAHYLMGAEDALRIDALIEEPGKVAALEPNGRMPAVVAAPDAVEKSEMVAPLVKDVCALLQTRFDLVVVNTAATWSDIQIDLIGIASRVLFVLDQRPTALRLCKRVLDLCARCGVASRSFVMVLNRCSRQSLFSSIDVSCTLSGIHAVEVREGGRGLSESLGSGAPFEAIDAGNAFCESVQDLLNELFPSAAGGEQPAAAVKKRRRRLSLGKR